MWPHVSECGFSSNSLQIPQETVERIAARACDCLSASCWDDSMLDVSLHTRQKSGEDEGERRTFSFSASCRFKSGSTASLSSSTTLPLPLALRRASAERFDPSESLGVGEGPAGRTAGSSSSKSISRVLRAFLVDLGVLVVEGVSSGRAAAERLREAEVRDVASAGGEASCGRARSESVPSGRPPDAATGQGERKGGKPKTHLLDVRLPLSRATSGFVDSVFVDVRSLVSTPGERADRASRPSRSFV